MSFYLWIEWMKARVYKDDTLRKALEQKFIIISKDSSKLEDNVNIDIAKMIGKPPSILYT
jgi:hypothetical protein